MSFVMRELSQEVGQHVAPPSVLDIALSRRYVQGSQLCARWSFCVFKAFGGFMLKGSRCLHHMQHPHSLRPHHGFSVTQQTDRKSCAMIC